MRKDMTTPGMGTAHQIWLRSIRSGGFYGQYNGTWTVVHELAHAWDHLNGKQFSEDLERYTGGRTSIFGKYHHSGTPPKGADANFTRQEDFAESVATFIYPQVAQNFIGEFFPNRPGFHYSNFYAQPRAMFVAQSVSMDPQQLRFLQGNRW